MKTQILLLAFFLLILGCKNQPIKKKQSWCLTKSSCTKDELENIKEIYSQLLSTEQKINQEIPLQIKKITHSPKSYVQKLADIKKILQNLSTDSEDYKKLSKIWKQIYKKNRQANRSLFKQNKLEGTYLKFAENYTPPSFYKSITEKENEIDIKSLLTEFENNNEKAVKSLDFEINKIYDFINFPLRIGVVIDPANPNYPSQESIINTIDILNAAFANAFITFNLTRIDTIHSELKIEDLSDDFYQPYRIFSKQYDLQDTISIFLFNFRENLCITEGNVISCSRKRGFSYILSEETNNIVLSKFDLDDHKIIVHEFGHFFGLYHTFEEYIFGVESVSGNGCDTTGDRICDTPADPGDAYEVYVNYSKCKMIGNTDPKTGLEYSPLINNYMSYYHPCYLKEYSFTPQQINVIFTASRSDLRLKFAREELYSFLDDW